MSYQALVPAAEYLRMSTDDQPNSIPFQKEAIRRYAEEHGFQLVATYADPGRSGVEIKHRPALRKLIRDVVEGNPGFKAILVYDVSRWGRFQDTDESAHYEFLCRSAGVPIHYCAEQFGNDGNISSSILKALKRTMAAEYSRELAAKVFAGTQLLASKGFRTGGTAGYGLRRMMILQNGRRKQMLQSGEHKTLKAGHIILVPGPPNEVATVRQIFTLATKYKCTPRGIARELNGLKIKYVSNKQWTEGTVRRLLKNEKYMGMNVWGKTHKPFDRYSEAVPRSSWTIKPHAFTPLVSAEQFDRAQTLLRGRNQKIKKADSYYLHAMKRVLEREGKLSEQVMQKRGLNPRTCARRFGSLMRAYELIGYKPSEHTLVVTESKKKFDTLQQRVLSEIKECYPTKSTVVRSGRRLCVELEKGIRISIYICRPLSRTSDRERRWLILASPKQRNPAALICLPNEDSTAIRSFYVAPEPTGATRHHRVLREGDALLAAGIRLDSLDRLFDAATTVSHWRQEDDWLVRGDTTLDERASVLIAGAKRFVLSRTQMKLMKVLIENAGSTVSQEMLFDSLTTSNEWIIRQHITKIRKKLGSRLRNRLVTIKDMGYRYD